MTRRWRWLGTRMVQSMIPQSTSNTSLSTRFRCWRCHLPGCRRNPSPPGRMTTPPKPRRNPVPVARRNAPSVLYTKGICGTVSAPLSKCHRRNKQAAAQVTPDSPSATWEEGEEPDSMEEELAKLDRATDLLGLAPDDEVVGELLQAQAALARTLWITRTLAAKALTNAKAAAADEAADRQEKIEWVEETEKYEERWRGGRWREEYLRKRGLPSADLQGAFGAMSGTISPGGTTQLSPGGTRHQLAELVDPLVETGAMEDALCAVCGGGDSEEPNEIIFCERCEVAVHQDCYGVDEVPEDDWLCWPCHVAEGEREGEGHAAQSTAPLAPRGWRRLPVRSEAGVCAVPGEARRAAGGHRARAAAKALGSAIYRRYRISRCGTGDSVEGWRLRGLHARRRTGCGGWGRGTGEANRGEHRGPHGIGAADEENCNKILPNSPAAVRRAALVGCDVHPGKDPHTVCPPVGAPVKKESDEGAVRWAHVVCAQCVPGIDFASAPEPGVASAVVRGLDRVPRSAFEADCIVCRRSEGAVVQCTAPDAPSTSTRCARDAMAGSYPRRSSRTASATRSAVVTPWPSGAVLRLVGIHARWAEAVGAAGARPSPVAAVAAVAGPRLEVPSADHLPRAMRWSCSSVLVTDSKSSESCARGCSAARSSSVRSSSSKQSSGLCKWLAWTTAEARQRR